MWIACKFRRQETERLWLRSNSRRSRSKWCCELVYQTERRRTLSYSLEITANEYACQGLELDNVGLCWGET